MERKRDQFTVLVNSSIPKAKPYLPCISMGKHNKLGLLLGIEKIVEGRDYWGMPYHNELKRKYFGVHIEYSQELPRNECWKEFEPKTFSRGTHGLGHLQWNGKATIGKLHRMIVAAVFVAKHSLLKEISWLIVDKELQGTSSTGNKSQGVTRESRTRSDREIKSREGAERQLLWKKGKRVMSQSDSSGEKAAERRTK